MCYFIEEESNATYTTGTTRGRWSVFHDKHDVLEEEEEVDLNDDDDDGTNSKEHNMMPTGSEDMLGFDEIDELFDEFILKSEQDDIEDEQYEMQQMAQIEQQEALMNNADDMDEEMMVDIIEEEEEQQQEEIEKFDEFDGNIMKAHHHMNLSPAHSNDVNEQSVNSEDVRNVIADRRRVRTGTHESIDHDDTKIKKPSLNLLGLPSGHINSEAVMQEASYNSHHESMLSFIIIYLYLYFYVIA